jgi:hypothetical protein
MQPTFSAAKTGSQLSTDDPPLRLSHSVQMTGRPCFFSAAIQPRRLSALPLPFKVRMARIATPCAQHQTRHHGLIQLFLGRTFRSTSTSIPTINNLGKLINGSSLKKFNKLKIYLNSIRFGGFSRSRIRTDDS